ncbi:fibronectin type III domain-containing protein [Leptospira yasudae]|uniref:fibronectin type III domain-containing protein n=1 Tax=Leptospira yasudae TaxID=2202201 RepID=UPI001090CC40|nr:fibronectin type III domain-containing protein [Leptospira yasudae]MBW0432368.1 fibronectin type III domain-containing protein [Leptospira yasudae]TGN01621.1 fibronectin type III domain-containing protein [Leptospira yasudae]
MRSIVRMIPALICLFISVSAYSEERKYTFYIEWNEVKGNNGYKVEIRKPSDPNTLVAEEKVVTNSLEFLIPAGEYEFRISALNRFGKPSSWSQWSAFLVEHDRPKSVYEAEKKQAAVGVASWKVWVPGLLPLERKEYTKASLIFLWFGALAVAGNAERTAGNSLAQSSTNDPGFLTLAALTTPLPVTFYLLQQRDEDKKEYKTHQNNQVGIGALALLTYGLNVWLEKRSFQSTTVLIESKSEGVTRWNSPNLQPNSFLSLGRIEMSFRKEFE